MYMYVYICLCMCVYVCVCMYVYHRYKESRPMQSTHPMYVKDRYANSNFIDKLTKWHQQF